MSAISPSNPLLYKLLERQDHGDPIRVAVVGAGDYGRTLVCQLSQIPGMRISVICDLNLGRAQHTLERAGYKAHQIVRPRTGERLAQAVSNGHPAVTADLDAALGSPVDVVVDCTGDPATGCRTGLGAVDQGKHVVMVNVEADVTVGCELASRARRANLVYTLADGDQPSLIVELVDWARCLGLEVATAGKWTKSYPPAEIAARLAAEPSASQSTVTYLDGTKTQVEMASTANACGLSVDVPGMHGPTLNLAEIPTRLCPRSHGGIMRRSGVVDYVNCLAEDGTVVEAERGGGVFIIVTGGSPYALRAVRDKGVPASADGTHLLIYRPYHLIGVETPWSIIKAVIEGVPTASPGPERRVEVVAEVKRDLAAGHVLGGLGANDVRGIALPAAQARAAKALPVGLAQGAVLTHDLPAGARLTYDRVHPPADSPLWRLRPPP